MTTALVRRELTPTVWSMIQEIAPFAKDSRLFGVATAPQAIMIMAKGHELGLPLTAAFEFVTVIQDKPALIPRGALALIYASPFYAGLKIDDQIDDKGNPVACVVWMKRNNGMEYTVKFTMADANRAGLVKPDSGWTKYPGNMLRWRAIGFCADVVFPDVLGGMKRADELGADLTPDGEVITTTWKVQSQSAPLPTMQTQITLQQLVDAYGAEKVFEAAGNKLPGTTEEVQAVAAKLNGGA